MKICRCCLSKENIVATKIVNGSQKKCDDRKILQTFHMLIGSQVDNEKVENICEICVGKLKDIHEFRAKCLESGVELKKTLQVGNDRKAGILTNGILKEPKASKDIHSNTNRSTVPLKKSNRPDNTIKKLKGQFVGCSLIKLKSSPKTPRSKADSDKENSQSSEKSTCRSVEVVDENSNCSSNKSVQVSESQWNLSESNMRAPPNSIQLENLSKLKIIVSDPPMTCMSSRSQYSTTLSSTTYTVEKSTKPTIPKKTASLPKFLCQLCRYSFKTKKEFHSHMLLHSREKGLNCSKCDAGFLYRSQLLVHSRSHEGGHPFKCDSCHEEFICFNTFQEHLQGHRKSTPFKCNKCDRAFFQIHMLNIHLKMHERRESSGDTYLMPR